MKEFAEIISAVEKGAKFSVNFEKRTCRLDGKLIYSEDNIPECVSYSITDIMHEIFQRYELYKHSVPSERSEHHRRGYFKALAEKDLSDLDMIYNSPREVMRCRLELFILFMLLTKQLVWQEDWGKWFYQSPLDKDLVILKEWIEPKTDGE